jgi:hypothetical protein
MKASALPTGYLKPSPASLKERDSTSQKGHFALYSTVVFALSAACLLSQTDSEPATHRLGDLEFKSRVKFKKEEETHGDGEALVGVVEDKWGEKFTYWLVRRSSIFKPLTAEGNDGYKSFVGGFFGGIKGGETFRKVDQLMAGKTPVVFSAGSLFMEGRLEPTIMVDLDHQGSRYNFMLLLHDVRRAEAEAIRLVRSITLVTKSGRERLRGRVSLHGEYFTDIYPIKARLPMMMSSHPNFYQRVESRLPGGSYLETDSYSAYLYHHWGNESLAEFFLRIKYFQEFLEVNPAADMISKQVGQKLQIWQGTDSQGIPTRFEMASAPSGGSKPLLYTALLLIKSKKKGGLPSRNEIGLLDPNKQTN